MSDVNQRFGPLPSSQTGQVGYTVFGDHVRCLGPRRRNDVAGRELGQNIGMTDALLIDPARRHGQKGFAVVGCIGTSHEIQLAASPADLPCPCLFRADLTIEVDGNTAVDGNEIIELADCFWIVDITHRCRQDILVMVQKFIEFFRAHTNGEDAFPPLERLFVVSNLP